MALTLGGCVPPVVVEAAHNPVERTFANSGVLDYTITIVGAQGNFSLTGAEMLGYANVTGFARIWRVHQGYEGDFEFVGVNVTKLLEEVGPWGPGGLVNFTCSDARVFSFLYEDVVCNATAQSVLAFLSNGSLLSIEENPRLVVVGTVGNRIFNWGNYTAKAVRNITTYGDVTLPNGNEGFFPLSVTDILAISLSGVGAIAIVFTMYFFIRKQ